MKLAGALGYLWALPTTLLGLAVAGLSAATGGRLSCRAGVLESCGGWGARLLRSPLFRAQAMALGHVIVAIDEARLAEIREHELAHVRQAELWGPLFLPAYLAASGWAVARGRHHYRDNWFERDAERRATASALVRSSALRPAPRAGCAGGRGRSG